MVKSISKKISVTLVLFLIFVVAFILTPTIGHSTGKSHPEMKLVYATYLPVGYPGVYDGHKLFVDMVNERGKGIVQLDAFFGGTLLKGRELLPGLQAGTADIVALPSAYMLGSFPVLALRSLPIWPNAKYALEKLKIGTPSEKLINNILAKKNFFQLGAAGVMGEYLWTRDKLVRRPEDIKGLKIRVAGKIQGRLIKAWGGAPVQLPSAEITQALQRGVIDGVLSVTISAKGRGFYEFCKYVLVHSFSTMDTPLFTLKSRWESLPNDVKKILMDAAIEWEPRYMGGDEAVVNQALFDEHLAFFKKHGMTLVYLNKEEVKDFNVSVKPVIDWWVNKVGTEDANKILNSVDYQY